jgi:hypothetical protein
MASEISFEGVAPVIPVLDDAIHAEWAQSGVEGRLGGPRDTEYGLREFGFVDSHGTLHRVRSRLAGPAHR